MVGPTPLVRRLAGQSVLSAFGEGVFLTGSAVFFTQIVGLSAAQVGLGLTIAGVVTFAFAVPLGRLADRFGPKRMWALGALVEALLYLAWPLARRASAPFVAMMVVLELVGDGRRRRRAAPTRSTSSRARSGCARRPTCAAPSTSASRSARCSAARAGHQQRRR